MYLSIYQKDLNNYKLIWMIILQEHQFYELSSEDNHFKLDIFHLIYQYYAIIYPNLVQYVNLSFILHKFNQSLKVEKLNSYHFLISNLKERNT